MPQTANSARIVHSRARSGRHRRAERGRSAGAGHGPKQERPLASAGVDGYTLDGAAQALGWSRQLVTARAKILKLPAAGQQLVRSGEIPVSAIDNLLAITAVSPAIADAVVLTIATGEIAGSQLVRDPSWTIGRALHNAPKGTFGAYLHQAAQAGRPATQ